jgi:hypothetical protein
VKHRHLQHRGLQAALELQQQQQQQQQLLLQHWFQHHHQRQVARPETQQALLLSLLWSLLLLACCSVAPHHRHRCRAAGLPTACNHALLQALLLPLCQLPLAAAAAAAE